MTFELLEKYRRQIWNCQQCSTCLRGPQNPFGLTGATPDRICPSYEKYRRLTYSAQGRILAARAMLEGKIKPTEELVSSLYECMLCGSCGPERMGRSSCCVDRMQVDILRAFRADLVKMGLAPTAPYQKIAAAIEKEGNRFGAKVKRDSWVPEGIKLPSRAETVFFVGCVSSYKSVEIARATVSLLHHSGYEFTTLGQGEKCCGNPLVNSGQLDAFEKVAEHNIAAIKKRGAKRLVTSCACCYNVLKFRYPEVIKTFDFEVCHVTEILAKLIEQGKIKPKTGVTGRLTYHDPCHLTRLGTPGAPVFEEPRSIIKSIPDIDFVEMEGNGHYTQCCGRNPVETPELALSTAINRINDAQAAGADTIITGCSFCSWSLSRAAKTMGAAIELFDITTLLAKCLDLRV